MANTSQIPESVKPLRPYQARAINLVRAEMLRGHRRVVLVAPTGSGKTRMGGEVVARSVARSRRVLWIAHRTELIDQTCAALAELGCDVGALAAKSAWTYKPEAPVQVASIQTMLAREVRPPADLLVWDECHHASEAAEEWASVLESYATQHVLGLTATPERGDGSGLAPLFTGLVVAASVRDLTNAGHLVHCEVHRPESLLAPNHLAQEPLDAYRALAWGQQGFLFARNVEEAQDFAAEFTRAGVLAACVHAKTPSDERARVLAEFRAGKVRMLTNVYVFTEGTDLPMAQVCILARGASTAGQYLQMVGRVLRPAPGKRFATLIDLRGVSHVHGPPEEDRVYRLEGKAIAIAGMHCKVCGAAIDCYPCPPPCGYAPEAGEGDSEESVVDDVRLNKFSRMIAQNEQQRDETAVRWVKQALLKGWNPKSVRHKWRAVYGEEMSMDRYVMALRENGQ